MTFSRQASTPDARYQAGMTPDTSTYEMRAARFLAMYGLDLDLTANLANYFRDEAGEKPVMNTAEVVRAIEHWTAQRDAWRAAWTHRAPLPDGCSCPVCMLARHGR